MWQEVFQAAASGGGGSFTFDKVWTNPNPGNEFAAQTVSIDLSEYDYVGIISRFFNNNSGSNAEKLPRELVIGKIGSSTSSGNGFIIYNSASAYNDGYKRFCRASASGVSFSNAYNHSGSATQNGCIPLYIFGIKCDDIADYIDGTATLSDE